MREPPVLIEGVRVRLRRSTPADAGAAFAIASDPEVMRYLEWPAPGRLADTQAYLDGCAGRWQQGIEYHWMIEHKSAAAAIGCIGCRVRGHAADFGCFVDRRHWRQGYATEAAALLVGWLRRQAEVVRSWATTDADNAASAAVLRKLGLVCEGVMRKATLRPNLGGGPRDTALFASVKPD